jgi:hypothetical protein
MVRLADMHVESLGLRQINAFGSRCPDDIVAAGLEGL